MIFATVTPACWYEIKPAGRQCMVEKVPRTVTLPRHFLPFLIPSMRISDPSRLSPPLTHSRCPTLELSQEQGQSHCLLLVEPVLLPNLGHTGVDRETLPGDRPLFYPNGKKNCGLGAAVRNALYQSTASPRQQQHGGTGRSQRQGPPSDWAGSSAYYSLSSESSTRYNSNKYR